MINALSLVLPISHRYSPNFTLKFFWILTFIIILSLAIFCVFQLNAYTKSIYLSQDYEKKIDQLTQENKILEINFSKNNSLDNIDDFIQRFAFEKTGKIEYVRLLEGQVVSRPR